MALFTKDHINQLKDISIIDYLLNRGYKLTHRSGNDVFFDLTNSNKKTGETSVMKNTNRFRNHSEGIGGDIIQLVQHLDNVDFRQAVEILSGTKIAKELPAYSKIISENYDKKKFSYNELRDDNKIKILNDYANSRGIDDHTMFFSRIERIKDNENDLFYLALRNESNGFSVRNKHIKGVRGDNNLTYIIHNPKEDFVVVEGMFEYLSILKATQNFLQNFIVLNSTSFIDAALKFIKDNPNNDFHILLNNDKAGLKASEKLSKLNNTFFYESFISNELDLNQQLLENGVEQLNKKLYFLHQNQEQINSLSDEYEKILDVLSAANSVDMDNINQSNSSLLNTNQMSKKSKAQNEQKIEVLGNTETIKKTPIELLEFNMQVLGLKDVWEKVMPEVASFLNSNENGKKSFQVDDLTFRRTGLVNTEANANVSLDFNKTDKGIFFNSFTVELKNSIIESVKNTISLKNKFQISLKKDESDFNFTVKEAINLLDGRSVEMEKDGWAKLNHLAKNEYGEFIINKHKFDLLDKMKNLKEFEILSEGENLQNAIKSLKKGDFALVKAKIDEKDVSVFLTVDAQYKKIVANDNNLYVHLNKEQKEIMKVNIEKKNSTSNSLKP